MLGLLQRCHSRGFALGRVCPTQLRVTAAGAVFTDSAAVSPEEASLYAAPEECALPAAPAGASPTGPTAAAPSAEARASSAAGASSGAGASGSAGVAGAASVEPRTHSSVAAAGGPSPAADVYSLGVLFFELFHPVIGDAAERVRTLRNLRHRVMPMQLLQVRSRLTFLHH